MSDRSATSQWTQPGDVRAEFAPAPPASRLPTWLAERGALEALAIGIAGVGLFMAALSYALPWEYHGARTPSGYSYYLGAAASGGLHYGLGLVLMVGGVVAAQFAPRRFNVPVRVFSGAVALMQIGLLSGVVVLAKIKMAVRSPSGSVSPPVEIGWGLIIAFLAVLALGAAIALSHRRSAPGMPG